MTAAAIVTFGFLCAVLAWPVAQFAGHAVLVQTAAALIGGGIRAE